MILKGKGPVEHLDRSRKAKMIEAFLRDVLKHEIKNLKMLDVGCGNGQISEYFSSSNHVSGVDIEDKRKTKNCEFDFRLIESESLPFDDDTFDVVLSHHVIEHVQSQTAHLSEILRVLKPNGVAYLGCPNKGSPFMAGHVGNDLVPNWSDIVKLFGEANIDWEEFYTRFLSEPLKYHCDLRVGQYFPESLIKIFKPWYPSHCFILRQGV